MNERAIHELAEKLKSQAGGILTGNLYRIIDDLAAMSNEGEGKGTEIKVAITISIKALEGSAVSYSTEIKWDKKFPRKDSSDAEYFNPDFEQQELAPEFGKPKRQMIVGTCRSESEFLQSCKRGGRNEEEMEAKK